MEGRAEDARIADGTWAELDRWAGFTIVELEWITGCGASCPENARTPSVLLPEQANAELELRARTAVDAECRSA
jgi:hypothetical protein